MKHIQTFGFAPNRAVPCRSFSGWEAAAVEHFYFSSIYCFSGFLAVQSLVRYGDARFENLAGCEGILEMMLT